MLGVSSESSTHDARFRITDFPSLFSQMSAVS